MKWRQPDGWIRHLEVNFLASVASEENGKVQTNNKYIIINYVSF